MRPPKFYACCRCTARETSKPPSTKPSSVFKTLQPTLKPTPNLAKWDSEETKSNAKEKHDKFRILTQFVRTFICHITSFLFLILHFNIKIEHFSLSLSTHLEVYILTFYSLVVRWNGGNANNRAPPRPKIPKNK